jgi:TatD DNase family protein
MLIDTHCHLNFKAFNADWQEAVQRAFDDDVRGIINVGSNYSTSCRAIEIARTYNDTLRASHDAEIGVSREATDSSRAARTIKQGKLYAAIGLHPVHVNDEELDIKKYEELASDSCVVAIGETGIDLFHNPNTIDQQKTVFKQFLELAYRSQRAIVIHNRAAGREIMEILDNTKNLPRGVMHFFSEDWSYAQKLFNLGFYISFTGVITLNSISAKTIEVIKKAPLDRIMIETDAPYVVPRRYKNKKIKRNEPAFVTEVAHRIAEIKNINVAEVAHRTTQTAIKLFGLM